MPNIKRTIWVVRHGSRADHANPDWGLTAKRPYDTPLADDGFVQARETGVALAKRANIAHVFCSPFLRTIQTAQEIGQQLDLSVHVEHGFCEMLYAKWFPTEPEHLPLAEVAASYDRIDATYEPLVSPIWPETEEQVYDRVHHTLQTVMAKYDGELLIVGHGGIVLSLANRLLGDGEALHSALCCLVKLNQMDDGSWQAECDGRDLSHLSGTQGEIRLK